MAGIEVVNVVSVPTIFRRGNIRATVFQVPDRAPEIEWSHFGFLSLNDARATARDILAVADAVDAVLAKGGK